MYFLKFIMEFFKKLDREFFFVIHLRSGDSVQKLTAKHISNLGSSSL
jgi:hypothetical protein